MVPLIWTEPARNDLESIFGYFNAISTKVAIHYSEEFIKAGDRLKIFPEMGPLEPSLEHLERNYRYVLVQHRYKMIYLFENEVCSILIIWDCKKNPKLLLYSDRF